MSQPTPISELNPTELAGVKAALFDVDNTLVGNDSSSLPSKKFQQHAKDLANTLPIGLATARPYSKVRHILEACDMKGLSILCNGAQIYDGNEGLVVVEHTIPIDACMNIMRRLQADNVFHWALDDSVDYFWQSSVAAGSQSLGTYARAVDLWDKKSQKNELVENYVPLIPITIVASHITERQKNDVLAYAKTFAEQDVVGLLAHQLTLEDGSEAFDVLITNRLSNKKDALQKVSGLLGVPAENFMAVGDGHNDKVIIEHVGYGVAMGNAVQEVKDVAKFITADWHDDGATLVLEKLKQI